MGARRKRLAALTLTAVLAVVLSASAGAGRRQPVGAQAGPPPKPQPCKGTVGGLAGVVKSGTAAPEPLCGTGGADRLTAIGGGDTVWGYHGRDTLRARNGKPDLVYGGPDADSGAFDACDRVYEVERAEPSPPACAGVRPRSLAARAQEAPLPRSSPVIECTTDVSGAWRVRFLRDPRMRAIDATPEIDWQFVAWSPVLYRLNGDRWVRYREHSLWLWDLTYDQQVASFPGNFWRRFSDNERTFLKFVVQEAGSYRVAVRYHWYAGDAVPERDVGYFATKHFGDYEDPTRRFCVFPALPEPPAAAPGG